MLPSVVGLPEAFAGEHVTRRLLERSLQCRRTCCADVGRRCDGAGVATAAPERLERRARRLQQLRDLVREHSDEQHGTGRSTM